MIIDLNMLALQDLKEYTEDQVKNHLACNYGKEDYDRGYDQPDPTVQVRLENLKVLLAYESVGDYGCDSSSYFLFRDQEGNLFETHGSHCSCYGFEDQFGLEPTTLKALQYRLENAESLFYTGGYDDNSEENYEKSRQFIQSLVSGN